MNRSLRGQHPSPEELDALLDQPDGAPRDRLAAHASTCEQCGELLEGMRRVRWLLQEESRRPLPVPPQVQARLEGCIAALSASAATSRAQPSTRPLVSRWLSLAAGLVVLAGTGLAASQMLTDGRTDGLAGGAVTASAGPFEQRAATPGSAGVGAGSASVASPQASPGRRSPQHRAAPPAAVALPVRGVTATGTPYSRQDLRSQVQTLIVASAAGGLGPLRSGSDGRETAGDTTAQNKTAQGYATAQDDAAAQDQAAEQVSGAPLADPTALAACLVAVGAPTRQPLVVDIGTWQSRPAALVVVAEPGASSRLLVSVVDPTCRTGADLLYRTTVDR